MNPVLSRDTRENGLRPANPGIDKSKIKSGIHRNRNGKVHTNCDAYLRAVKLLSLLVDLTDHFLQRRSRAVHADPTSIPGAQG